ncbi:MAG: phosphodiester glycosidase family protein [Desulfovibrionaceae bacterium]|nr:phosphodiester glycosidase family protein [Desulfovibrionaceae bacterium]
MRIDPTKVQFVLGSASSGRHAPLTLAQWAESKNLLAVINASMYLPDNLTSTGYMREGGVLNNGRMAKKFGAFFVANPDSNALARATILERDTLGLDEKLGHYSLVVQNYRLISSTRQVLWRNSPIGHAIAAVGLNGGGEILFIYANFPLSPHDLGHELLKLPLDIRTTMYVEGGAQAGLFINHPTFKNFLPNQELPLFLQKTLTPILPNVLGIQILNDATPVR